MARLPHAGPLWRSLGRQVDAVDGTHLDRLVEAGERGGGKDALGDEEVAAAVGRLVAHARSVSFRCAATWVNRKQNRALQQSGEVLHAV